MACAQRRQLAELTAATRVYNCTFYGAHWAQLTVYFFAFVSTQDGRTPLQVLLQCHPVLMSAPSRAFGKVDDHRTEEGRAKLAAIAVGLRDFMAERVKDSATQSLQAELGMAVPNLLPGCWS